MDEGADVVNGADSHADEHEPVDPALTILATAGERRCVIVDGLGARGERGFIVVDGLGVSGVVGEDGQTVGVNIPEQEEFDGGFMLDLSIGKYIRLQKGRSMSINLTLNNVTNNTNMKTGGYEQNRDDAYDDGRERPYQFSRHSKYYYAQGLNGFLNVNFRF